MRIQAELLDGVGRFQTEQAAADYRADFGLPCPVGNGLQVFDGAIHQAGIAVAAFHWRYEGVGAGGQYEQVIRCFVAVNISYALARAINGGDGRFEAQLHAVIVKKAIGDQR